MEVISALLAAQLVLGRDASVDVSLHAPAGATVVASAGKIGTVRAREGELTATLLAPEEKFPQLAIVAAVAPDGSIADWTVVRISGRATVKTSSKPGAKVRLRVGDAEYGPKVADGAGKAEFDAVVIPPGVKAAQTFGEDRLGNVQEAAIDLAPPPLSRTLAVCGSAGLTILVAGTDGAPARDESFDVAVSTGTLAAPERIAEGSWLARFDATLATSLDAIATAAIRGDSAPPASCRIAVPPEPPEAVAVTPDRGARRAGEGPVEVRVAFRYAGRREPAPVPVRVSVDTGSVTEPVKGEDGTWHSTWTLPDEIRAARASVTAESGALRATSAVETLPGAVARIELAVDKERLRADGRKTAIVDARAFDAFGNPIDPSKLTRSATAGILEGSTYTAPLLFERASSEIVVEGDGVRRAATLDLLPVRARLAIGARAGWTSNLGRISTPIAGLEASVRVSQRVGLGVEAGRFEDRGESGGVAFAVRAVPVLARFTWHIADVPVGLHAGASVGALIADARTYSAESGALTTFLPHPAAGVFAGAEHPAGPGRAGIELGWRQADLSTESLVGNAGGLYGAIVWRWEVK